MGPNDVVLLDGLGDVHYVGRPPGFFSLEKQASSSEVLVFEPALHVPMSSNSGRYERSRMILQVEKRLK